MKNKEYNKNSLYGEWVDVELRPGKLWVIVSPLTFVRPTGQIVKIRPYLITDYATIPKIFRRWFPHRCEFYDIAAAFHDDCLTERWHDPNHDLTFGACHRLFNEVMAYLENPKWRRRIMYRAVQFADVFIRLMKPLSLRDRHYIYSFRDLTVEEIDKFNKIVQAYPISLNTSYEHITDETLKRKTIKFEDI